MILSGMYVAEEITSRNKEKVKSLRVEGIIPTLAVVRVGENPSDVAYEKSLCKRAEVTGVKVVKYQYDEDVSQEKLMDDIRSINEDAGIHGILMFRPLPSHIDEEAMCNAIDYRKDIDGVSLKSMAGVYSESEGYFSPCTAQACIEMLDYYDISLEGKRVCVVGRSLVIGRPVALMCMNRNATVTVLHSRTRKEDFDEACRNAEIVIAAVGSPKLIGSQQLGENQIILDVGTNVDEDGSLCGDVDFEAAEKAAAGITPVPGGIGRITTAVLMKHVVAAAEKLGKI